MRITRPTLLAGLAMAFVGVTAVAAAGHKPAHVMTVRLPDGRIEQIRYTGDVAPHVVIRDDAAPAAGLGFLHSVFGADSPFAQMDRIAAEMDRQSAEMMRQVSAMAAQAPGSAQPGDAARMVSLGDAPAGASYSYVSRTTVNGRTCTTSVQSVAQGAGKAPQMLRKVSGDGCDAKAMAPAPAVAPVPPAPPAMPHAVSASAAPKAPPVPAADTI